jgi:hypothetical protein
MERPANGDGDRLPEPFQVDRHVAEPARVGDALGQGEANFAVDREAVDSMASVLPGGMETGRRIMQTGVAFRRRAIRYLMGAGIRQFLSLGTGISGPDRDHLMAQELAPESRVVYWTGDPTVLAHAHQLKGTPEGAVASMHGNFYDLDADAILRHAGLTLDLARPVAIVIRVLASVPDGDAQRLVARFMAEVAPGSHLVIVHLARDVSVDELALASERLANLVRGERLRPLRGRTQAEVARFFDGLDLVSPGVVTVDRWRPDGIDADGDANVDDDGDGDGDGELPSLPGNMVPPIYGGVGRKR